MLRLHAFVGCQGMHMLVRGVLCEHNCHNCQGYYSECFTSSWSCPTGALATCGMRAGCPLLTTLPVCRRSLSHPTVQGSAVWVFACGFGLVAEHPAVLSQHCRGDKAARGRCTVWVRHIGWSFYFVSWFYPSLCSKSPLVELINQRHSGLVACCVLCA